MKVSEVNVHHNSLVFPCSCVIYRIRKYCYVMNAAELDQLLTSTERQVGWTKLNVSVLYTSVDYLKVIHTNLVFTFLG